MEEKEKELQRLDKISRALAKEIKARDEQIKILDEEIRVWKEQIKAKKITLINMLKDFDDLNHPEVREIINSIIALGQ